jgi:hypothetical protein
MRQIHPVFYLWAMLFPFFSVNGYLQHILVFFKLIIPDNFPKNLAPLSINSDQLTQSSDSFTALAVIKDGKKQPIAAQLRKKNSHTWMDMYVNSRQREPVSNRQELRFFNYFSK